MNTLHTRSIIAGCTPPVSHSQRNAFKLQRAALPTALTHSHQRRTWRHVRCPRAIVHVQASSGIVDTIAQLRGGAASLAVFLQTAPPSLYLVYMLAAGFGLPCSEDALVVWVGSNIAKGVYGGWQQNLWVLSIIYFGVVVSDMVTFYMGVGLKMGFFKKLKDSLFSNSKSFDRAISVINKRSRSIGVAPQKFALGAAVGALGTIPLQLTVGYFLRDTSNLYLTALAIMTAPNLFGQLVGPVASALGLYLAGKEQSKQASEQPQEASTNTVQKSM